MGKLGRCVLAPVDWKAAGRSSAYAALAASWPLGMGRSVVSSHGVRPVRSAILAAATAAALTVVIAATSQASAASGFTVLASGHNGFGQLGTGNYTSSDVPVAVQGLTEVTAISAGNDHGLALLKSGKVMAWGANSSGQLGNGTTTGSDAPVEVKGLSEAIAVSAGGYYSLALLKSGKVMAWGENEWGQLGNGKSKTSSDVPVEVKGLTEVTAIAAAEYHGLALLKSGKIMAWGRNQWGQLGDGNTTNSNVPVEVKSVTEAVAIAGGDSFSLALLKSGRVIAWGENGDGQLGTGNTSNSDVPVEVKELSEGVAISARGGDSFALLKSGQVKAWGFNEDGELGDGNLLYKSDVPVEVKGLTEVTAISSGRYNTFALLKSNEVMTWGYNEDGAFGNGTTTGSDVPVEVNELAGATGIAGGGLGEFSLADYTFANTVLPSVTTEEWGKYFEGQKLAAVNGAWTGPKPTSYGYQWESCNSEGGACENTGVTTATFTPTSSNVGHTLRVVVTATNTSGSAKATSAATPPIAAQTSPEAHVLNSSGQIVQSYGASYAGEPGGQIQQAENYAHTFGYPKVTLDSGVFTVSVPYGRGEPVWPKCEGIFAYSSIVLQGVSGSVIKNEVEASNPCRYSGWGKLTALVFVGAEPANINTQGSSLNVSSIKLQSEWDGEYGLMVDGTSGAGLTVNGIVSTGAIESNIEIGVRGLPVVGTAGSPAQIVDNTVELGGNEGIVVEGSYIIVAHNQVHEVNAHGIAVYGNHSAYVEVAHNKVTSASWGFSLDGSEENEKHTEFIAIGEHNTIYDNEAEETCVGTVLFRQVDAGVAGNYYADPYTGWQPSKHVGPESVQHAQACPEFAPTGVAVSNSCVNGVWANQVWNYVNGVEVFDGNTAPASQCPNGTTANYFGRVLEVGRPWPWKMEGNWINNPHYGFFAEVRDDSPAHVSGNEFAGNVVDEASLGGWDWTNPEITEVLWENAFG
jgi:alpha-tubulin suppressor-like RCC1 family protein